MPYPNDDIVAFAQRMYGNPVPLEPIVSPSGVMETAVPATPQAAPQPRTLMRPPVAPNDDIVAFAQRMYGPPQPLLPTAPTPTTAVDATTATEPLPDDEKAWYQKIPEAFAQRKAGLDIELGMGAGTYEDALSKLTEYRQYQQNYRDMGGNWFVGAAGMLPDMIYGLGGRLTGWAAGTAIGAGIAGLLNLIPGLAATPEEAVTVPVLSGAGGTLGGKIGGNIGGAAPMYFQGKGQLFADMIDRGIDPKTAWQIASIGAAPYAAIEMMNIYLPGRIVNKGASVAQKRILQDMIVESVQKTLAKTGAGTMAANIGGQVLGQGFLEANEEFAQQLNNDLWNNVAAWISDNPNASKPLKAILKEGIEQFKAAIGPSLVLGIPGGTLQGLQKTKTEQTRATLEETYTKAGYTPDQVSRIMAAKTGQDRVAILNRIEQEIGNEPNIETEAEMVPQGTEGTAIPGEVAAPPAPQEIHPNQPEADRMAERIGRPGKLTAIEAPADIEGEATEAAAKQLGFKKVVWLQNDSDRPFQATTDQGILYVANNTNRPGVTAALHEAIEVARQDNPEGFSSLHDLVRTTAETAASEEQLARIKDAAEKLGENAPTELTVQILQEFAGDKNFWQELTAKTQSDPQTASTLSRIIEKIVAFIDDFLAKMKGADRLNAYFSESNLPQVRTALVELLNQAKQAPLRATETALEGQPSPQAIQTPSPAAEGPVTTPETPPTAPASAETTTKTETPPPVEQAKAAEPASEPSMPESKAPPSTTTPQPTAEQPTTPAPSSLPIPKIEWTAKQIDTLSFKELKSIARTTKLQSGITLHDSLGTNPTKEQLRSGLRRLRREYLASVGQEERARPSATAEKSGRMTAEDKRAQDAQESELLDKIERGELTTEAAAKTEGVSKAFQAKMQSYGKSQDNPRYIGTQKAYRDPDTGTLYAIRPNGESVAMPKKSNFAKTFDRYEKGKNIDLTDVPFMAAEAPISIPDYKRTEEALEWGAKNANDPTAIRATVTRRDALLAEFQRLGPILDADLENNDLQQQYQNIAAAMQYQNEALSVMNQQAVHKAQEVLFMAAEEMDDLEAEVLAQMRKRGAVKTQDGNGPDFAKSGYPRALQHMKTVSTSVLTYRQVRERIERRLRDDPEAQQTGYTMQKLADVSRKWIEDQGGLYEAYQAIGTKPFFDLALNEQNGVLSTVQQYLAAMGYETEQEVWFDLAEDLNFQAAGRAMLLGRAIKAFDMWRDMAPNNVREAYIFAKRQASKAASETVKKRDRIPLADTVRQETDTASKASLEEALRRATRATAERDTARAELDLITKSWAETRRELFRSGKKPSQAILDQLKSIGDAALERIQARKQPPTAPFMAMETGNAPDIDLYNDLVKLAALRTAQALSDGKSELDARRDLQAELRQLAPELENYHITIMDQGAASLGARIEAAAVPRTTPRQPRPDQEPDPRAARDTEPNAWVQNVLDQTSATLDEILKEIEDLQFEGKLREAKEAQQKAMERLQRFAQEQGITLAEAQAIFYQRTKERQISDRFEWAASNADPIQVQNRIQENSLLYWGRINGMPDTQLNLAVRSNDPLGELGKWAKENGIVAQPTTPFAEGYRNLDAGLTAQSLKIPEPKPRRQRSPEEQRLATIEAQGRLIYELKEMDKQKTGKNRALDTILREIIRDPLQRGRSIVEQLQERIIDRGWPPEDGKRLAKEIADNYAELIERTMRRRLLRRFEAENIKRSVEDGEAIEDIIMASRTQQLTDSQLMERLAQSYGLKPITPEVRAEIERLGKIIEEQADKTGDPNSELVRRAQEDLNNYLYTLLPHSTMQLAMTFRKQLMLSGFSTAVQNTVSNAFQEAVQIETTILKEIARGNWDLIPIMLRGLIEPLRGEAGKEFVRIIKERRQPWKSGYKYDQGFNGDPTKFHPLFTKGGYWNPLHWFTHVFSWLSAQDYPFYLTGEGFAASLQTAKELRANSNLKGKQLYREVARKMGWGTHFNNLLNQARTKGLTGQDALIHAYELRRAQWSDEARLAGHAFGNISTYNVEKVPGVLGKISRKLTATKAEGGFSGFLAEMLLPFVNIPFSVSNAVIANSPLGFFRAFSNRQIEDAVTGNLRDVTADEKLQWTIQATQGTLLMVAGLFFLLGKWRKWKDDEDKTKDKLPPIWMTAYGPADTNVREKWYAAGMEPYSIYVNGKVISYKAWSPLLGMLAPMGALADMLMYGQSDDPTKAKNFKYRLAMNSLLALPQAVLDQTNLMQISDLLDALQSAKAKTADVTTSKINGIIARTATSFVVPNLFKQIENIWDPSIYSNDTLGAAFLQNLPFAASSTLNKRLNMFGEEITQSRLRQFYQLPVPRKPFDADPVAEWLLANDISMGPPHVQKIEKDPRTNKYLPRSLDEEEKYRFMKIWGPLMRKELERRIPYYKDQPKENIEDDIARWRTQVRTQAWWEFQKAEDARGNAQP